MNRRLPRLLAAGPIGAMIAVGLTVIPATQVQAQTVVHTRAAEASGPLNGTEVRPLEFPARDVAVHWAGNPDAVVTIAFSFNKVDFGPAQQVVEDEVGEQRRDGRTYGGIQYAGGAVAARLTSDRPLGQVTVLALADGERTVRNVPVPAGKPAGAAAAQPEIKSRLAWGAVEDYRFKNGTEVWPPVFQPVQKLVVHHTAGTNGDTDPAATIRSMYYYHAITQGWGDIGYNYLITEGGTIYKGRHSHTTTADDNIIGEDGFGRGVTAGHAYGYNSGTVGVAFLGTLTANDATTAARSAMERILAWEADAHGIDPLGTSLYTNPTNGTQRFFPNIAGHREVPDNATECPGDKFFPSLPELRKTVVGMTTQTSFDRTAPAPVANLIAASGKRAITLTWTGPAEPPAGYEIFRSISQTGPFSSLGTTTGTGYVDSGLTPKKTYWYVVTAFDQAGNRSSTAPVKGTSG